MKSPEIKEIKAPAKINLGLYITGKRPDGYHELASIFLPLELHDVIKVSATEVPGFEISVSGPFADQCPANNDNIIYRAYKLLCENCKIDQGVRVGLCKNIPAGAGLGGGSSDAAGFIVLMNDLLGLRMDNAALKNIAAKVGADVPFFIDCKPALVEGIGEIIRPFELKRDYWALIVKPREGLSTADVYKKYKFDLTLIDKSDKYLKQLGSLSSHGLERAEDLKTLTNDLEPVSVDILPEIAVIRDCLGSFDPVVTMMSGSGSSVFALFDRPIERDVVSSQMQKWFFCKSKIMRGHYGHYRNQGLSG